MRTFSVKYPLIAILALMVSAGLEAQIRLGAYIDAGDNNVSDGFYCKTALSGSYQLGRNRVEGGCQFDLKSNSTNFLTGTILNFTREFSVKDFDFEIQGLFMDNFFSELVHELDWGALAIIERKHFTCKLGTEFRTYHITRQASEDYDIESNKNLHENWNIMYLLGYNLKPIDNKWNVGISITNIDHYLINQEINPMFYLRGKYDISSPLTLFAESWYKSAGMLNISATYFGFFIRTGLIWELDLEK